MSKNRYCVFDVETPNKNNDRISAIGVAIIEDEAILDSFHYLVNPEVKFDSFNINLTGISEKTVESMPNFHDIWSKISAIFLDSILVAHNASFDLSVLSKTLDAYHIPVLPFQYLCTLRLSRELIPHLENYKLDALCEHYAIPLNHHQAGSDSLACANLFLRLIETGADLERFINVYHKPIPRSSCTIARSTRSDRSLAIKELTDLLSRITEDGVLTANEVMEVITWLDKHQIFADQYPFNIASTALRIALADGVLVPEERLELCSLFKELADPVSCEARPLTEISIDGKLICLTGNFVHGSRSALEAVLSANGAIIKKTVSKKLDYLIVGEKGSDAWITQNYGTKVNRAKELQQQGADICILSEADFFAAVCVEV